MTAKGKKPILIISALIFVLAASLAGSQMAGSYPGAGTGFEGWTAEFRQGPGDPRHVQIAASGGHLYQVCDSGSDIVFRRTGSMSALGGWTGLKKLDIGWEATARDAYIDACGSVVVVSFKELMGSKWATVVRVSNDCGDTWTTWYDSSPGWNNYEAHVAIQGNRVHCAYVSDYEGRNEVYYLRFTLAGALDVAAACVSDSGDAVAATQPCIEAASDSSANIYYVHGNAGPHPIYESYTENSGGTWNVVSDIIPALGTDMSWPECDYWVDGGDRRKIVVCDGDTGSNHHVYARRYITGAWQDVGGVDLVACLGDATYPQIANKGTDLLLVYRNSGGSIGNEGAGRYNDNTGENNCWHPIDDLFYNNMPYDNPGSIDCCASDTRFYAASAATGDDNVILIKREDTTDPVVSINDPGTYHSGDFNLTATAWDDFKRTADSFLSPASEHYDEGILHAEYYYRESGSDAWAEWPQAQGGVTDNNAPWSKTFPGGSLAEGSYDFRVVVTDTADRVSENILTGVIVDRTPPQGVDLEISTPDGDNGWFISQPGNGPRVVAHDAISGIRDTFYKFDDAADWIVYSQPFTLIEGEHSIYYYAQDNAGNVSSTKEFPYKADFTDPSGDIDSPAPGGYFRKEIGVEASCADGESGVSTLTWLVDGVPLLSGSEEEAVLNISGLKDGQHSLELEVKDTAGRTCRTSPVLFYKDVTPPAVEVLEPTGEHWVRGMVTIKSDIRDNLKVGRAEFYVDGVKVDERTSAPWMASWDTSTAKNGYHALQVKAWDAAGNQAEVTASGEVTVYVGNNISETNHFAEGCTRSGFDTWLCLQNPGDEQASVTVNYYLGEGQGATSARTYSLPPHSRSTIYVNGDVGADKDVSIQVTSSKPIVSERPMYFDYQGTAACNWKGCHTAQGAHFPREDWYFAEGCTRQGFETWLCLQNPEGREAVVEVEYMMENGASLERTYRVSPWSRGTVLVNGEVGPDHDVSMRVTSQTPIVAERPVYFLYQGMWDGGHNVMGAAQPETEWYFAEGCTRTGFNQWLCLQNPNEEATTARIVYIMEDGGRIEREYCLAPRSRFTVNVNNDVARQHDVSACISSELPIVVERPMYFLYNSIIDEGSNAMGVCKPGSSWYLAEGCTRAGFEEWICLMNPGEETAQVALRFMLEDTSQREHVVSVPPGTRVTVKVNDIVGPEHDVSCEVMSDRPVIVERPMYSIYRGSCPSGDTLSGYTFNP